jgi:hypothetical protein
VSGQQPAPAHPDAEQLAVHLALYPPRIAELCEDTLPLLQAQPGDDAVGVLYVAEHDVQVWLVAGLSVDVTTLALEQAHDALHGPEFWTWRTMYDPAGAERVWITTLRALRDEELEPQLVDGTW